MFNTSSFRQLYSYVPWASAGGGSLDMVKAGTNVGSYNNILNLDYTYDVDDNITSIYDGKLLNTQTFTYDALNRLTSAEAIGGASAYTLENYTYNAATGNLASKAGVSYTYADTAHKHAVTSLSNGNAYTYDANGNQVTRTVGSVTHTLTYDAENRLTKVMNGATTIATFVYDGDGNRVQSTINGVTTVYIGNYYEKSGANITKYYYAGTMRVAMKSSSGTTWLLGDHLGSTSLAVNGATGQESSEQRYMPFGEVRYTSGTLPTKYTFTGQYSNVSDFGLMYYGARWYDVSLGRFAQADTIIPGAGNPLAWDRYSYTLNNPVKYTDPSGHWADRQAQINNYDPDSKPLVISEFAESLGITFDEGWTQQQKLEVLLGAFRVGVVINDVIKSDSPENAFVAVFGYIEISWSQGSSGNYCEYSEGGVACQGNFHSGQWNIAHELGHRLNVVLSGVAYEIMRTSAIYDADGNFITGWNGISFERGFSGYINDTNSKYCQHCYILDEFGNRVLWDSLSLHQSEEWADMFMNWAMGSFAQNPAGNARMAWMNATMFYLLAGY